MIVRRYMVADRAALDTLLELRRTDAGQLPKLGFVVMDGPSACAFGFMRKVEGRSYLFDSLISDPRLDSEQRHLAMQLLWNTIVKTANGKPLIGYSTDEGTISRAHSMGFVTVPHTILLYKGASL